MSTKKVCFVFEICIGEYAVFNTHSFLLMIVEMRQSVVMLSSVAFRMKNYRSYSYFDLWCGVHVVRWGIELLRGCVLVDLPTLLGLCG